MLFLLPLYRLACHFPSYFAFVVLLNQILDLGEQLVNIEVTTAKLWHRFLLLGSALLSVRLTVSREDEEVAADHGAVDRGQSVKPEMMEVHKKGIRWRLCPRARLHAERWRYHPCTRLRRPPCRVEITTCDSIERSSYYDGQNCEEVRRCWPAPQRSGPERPSARFCSVV